MCRGLRGVPPMVARRPRYACWAEPLWADCAIVKGSGSIGSGDLKTQLVDQYFDRAAVATSDGIRVHEFAGHPDLALQFVAVTRVPAHDLHTNLVEHREFSQRMVIHGYAGKE